jgi:hypothetical protein
LPAASGTVTGLGTPPPGESRLWRERTTSLDVSSSRSLGVPKPRPTRLAPALALKPRRMHVLRSTAMIHDGGDSSSRNDMRSHAKQKQQNDLCLVDRCGFLLISKDMR